MMDLSAHLSSQSGRPEVIYNLIGPLMVSDRDDLDDGCVGEGGWLL